MVKNLFFFFGVSLLPGEASINNHEGCCAKVSTNLNCMFLTGRRVSQAPSVLFTCANRRQAIELGDGCCRSCSLKWDLCFWLIVSTSTHSPIMKPQCPPQSSEQGSFLFPPRATYLLREPCSVNPRWNKSTMDPREKRCYI